MDLIKLKIKCYLIQLCLLILLLGAGNVFSQHGVYSKSDSLIFVQKVNWAKKHNLFGKPVRVIFPEIAKSFIGTEYKSHTLESEVENGVINLSGFDCYTLVETSLALARIFSKGDSLLKDFLNEIKNIRYRNGVLDGYFSRLHYFTDWIYDLSMRGIIKDKTKEIGGIEYLRKINFMSSNSHFYEKLKSNESLILKFSSLEKSITERKKYYVPENSIEKAYLKINEGDIIAITTNIKGLDVSHVGIAMKGNNGKIYLLHSPNIGKKVQISKLSLADYIKSHKHQTGIIVCESLEISK